MKQNVSCIFYQLLDPADKSYMTWWGQACIKKILNKFNWISNMILETNNY